MSTAREFRQLGMDRRIPRRDFLNGMALGVAAAALGGPGAGRLHARVQAPGGEPAYPPMRLGLRGQHPSAIESFAAILPGQAGLVLDSYGMLAVCLNRRSAADELGLIAGDQVQLAALDVQQPSATAVSLGRREHDR